MFPMTFLFLGGRLAIDLLNTVIARDLLGRREDVAAWGAAAGVVSRRELRRGGREPADLRAFREALRRGLVAWAAAGTPPPRRARWVRRRRGRAAPRSRARSTSAHPVLWAGGRERRASAAPRRRDRR